MWCAMKKALVVVERGGVEECAYVAFGGVDTRMSFQARVRFVKFGNTLR